MTNIYKQISMVIKRKLTTTIKFNIINDNVDVIVMKQL